MYCAIKDIILEHITFVADSKHVLKEHCGPIEEDTGFMCHVRVHQHRSLYTVPAAQWAVVLVGCVCQSHMLAKPGKPSAAQQRRYYAEKSSSHPGCLEAGIGTGPEPGPRLACNNGSQSCKLCSISFCREKFQSCR